MRKPVLAPDLGLPSPLVSLWLVEVGESVFEGDRLVEVALDGAIVEVLAPVAGRLVEKKAAIDEGVQPGQILGYIEED